MILLDTHIWIWWVVGDPRFTEGFREVLETHRASGIGVSAISCWEVAKLVELNRVGFHLPVGEWLERAATHEGCRVLALTPRIAAASGSLPGVLHRDPADQIIVATARVWDCPLLTRDRKLLAYPHVDTPQP